MHSAILSQHPLRTREDLQAVFLELWRPLRERLECEGAAISLEANSASYGATAMRLETFARPLWGAAAFVAGGGKLSDGALVRRVLLEGVDPGSPRFWGRMGDRDQRVVEMASIAAALWLAPELLWTPLNEAERRHVATWLMQVNERELWDNNWLFFRVLVNGALRAVGVDVGTSRDSDDLRRLDTFYRGDGWYADGRTPHFDYYLPMAMHFYGLFYAGLAGKDALLAKEFEERARAFAPDFATWFAPDGSALPIGRSLTYRFAQGAFWGGLAWAGVDALPWGEIKHLHLQHLRWWLRQPIFVNDGVLSVGYAYPNLIMGEAYNAPGSPYWAMKAMLPLALPAEHPFWQVEERAPTIAAVAKPRGRAGLVVCRDEKHGHVFALTNNPMHPSRLRHSAQKYGKFAYSTTFAFNVPVGGNGPQHGAADSMLLLTEDGRDWRGREELTDEPVSGFSLHSLWHPWADVVVDSWLLPVLPGHVRLHRIQTPRKLKACEGGFPVAVTEKVKLRRVEADRALLDNGDAFCGLWDLSANRKPELVLAEPNTNLLHPLTALAVLTGEIPPGTTWLFTAVAGWPDSGGAEAAQAWREELRVDVVERVRVWRGAEMIQAVDL